MSENIYIAVDFETTGLDSFTNQIIEIGAVKFNDTGEVLGEYQKLIKPTCAIESGAKRVHKITEKMLKNEAPISDVWREFITWCGEFTAFVAHNATFEAGFIAQLYDNDLPDFVFIDTLKMARSRLPDKASYKLTDLVPKFKNAHRALPDALATKSLLLELIATYKTKKIPPSQLKLIYDIKPKASSNEPTARQLGYIKSLGGQPNKVSTKQEASIYIDQLKNGDADNEPSIITKIGIAFGIILLPYIFSWFTLKPGYSHGMRIFSFAWMFFGIYMFFIN